MADTNTWVLDLSTNPPDIYNSAVQEHAHNALQPPYPANFWFVNQTEDDINHMGELQYHSPCFEPPYPLVFWGVSTQGTDVIHGGELQYHSPCIGQPYPYVFWFTNSTEDDVIHNAEYPYEKMGAFRKSNLGQVKITPTTKLLGSYSFAQTSLSKVMIANDCVYYPTTFPSTCEVSFYEEV